jgi:hypothetical protein
VRLYRELGFQGASSHSGRAGGSLRDVQQLAGHQNLTVTARYIEGDAAAKRKVVDLI